MSQLTKAPSETHQYWFRYCAEAVATGVECPKPPCGCEIHGHSCWDDGFYVDSDTSFASEYGWVGMPSVESLSPVLESVVILRLTCPHLGPGFRGTLKHTAPLSDRSE